jgi:hypothetical protein
MIERRRFLHLAGGTAVATAIGLPFMPGVATAASTLVKVGTRWYRSDGSGRIEVSTNSGRTWALHTDLGSAYRVQLLSVDSQKRVNARVGYGTRTFKLRLGPDLKKWLTVG